MSLISRVFLLVPVLVLVAIVSVIAPLPNRIERASNPTLSTFLQRVSGLLHAFQRFIDQHDLSHPRQLAEDSLRALEEMWETLQTVLRHFERLASEMPTHLHQPVEESLRGIRRHLHHIREAIQSDDPTPQEPVVQQNQGCCQRVSEGNIGPPRYNIQRPQLQIMLDMKMTLSEIARSGLLGTTCRGTLYNHCRRMDIPLSRQRYSNISHENLQQVVRDIHREQPNSGSEEVRATLSTARGLIVHRERVRNTLAEVDPRGTASRWAKTTQRRTYSVTSPNSLWHLDNNHALKRWRFYIHGGIDGFSRFITFLCVTLGNTKKLALICFIKGIRRRGLPSRIRLDKGSEYNDCHRLMEWQMGPNRGSAMRGQSVHNQRIERLWRNVFTKVLDTFYKLFYHMEDNSALCIDKPIHMFALHYTYLLRIQAAVTHWANIHNNRGIRTAHHQTPQQMWFVNMVKQKCSLQGATQRPSIAVRNVGVFKVDDHNAEILNRFGVDLSDTRTEIVMGSSLGSSLSADDLALLRMQVHPLRPSNAHGVDIYQEVLNFVFDCIERQQDEINEPTGEPDNNT